MDNPRVPQGDYSLETLDRKLEWFRRLTPSERHSLIEQYMRMMADANPELVRRDAPYPAPTVRVLELPRR